MHFKIYSGGQYPTIDVCRCYQKLGKYRKYEWCMVFRKFVGSVQIIEFTSKVGIGIYWNELHKSGGLYRVLF